MNLESAERLAAKPWFLVAFNAALIMAWLVWGVDVANFLISICTVELLLLGMGAQRRSQLALHAKLDALVIATPDASDELAHIEEKPERAIAEARP